MLELILFQAYISPVGDIIKSYGVRFHQYADDNQLHIAMRTTSTDAGLSILADCAMDVPAKRAATDRR